MSTYAVAQIKCASWDDFKTQLRASYGESTLGAVPPLYRGHAKASWRLQSPWERELDNMSADVSTDLASRLLGELLSHFKDMAVGLPGVHSRELLHDDDWWALGRHFGLTTPLLDWTKSPYVAAFFAFTGFLESISPGVTTAGVVNVRRILSKESTEKVAIWAFLPERLQEEAGLPQGLEVVHSRPDVGHRQRAQRGVFTRITRANCRSLEDFVGSLNPDQPPLLQYLIPGWEAAKAITELRMMNITFATLFPDLAGAALQANFEMVAMTLLVLAGLDSETWQTVAQSPFPRKQ